MMHKLCNVNSDRGKIRPSESSAKSRLCCQLFWVEMPEAPKIYDTAQVASAHARCHHR